jgi:hypothetical protein
VFARSDFLAGVALPSFSPRFGVGPAWAGRSAAIAASSDTTLREPKQKGWHNS